MDYKEAFEKLVWEMSDGLDNYDESVKVSYLWDKAKELDKEVKSLLFGVGSSKRDETLELLEELMVKVKEANEEVENGIYDPMLECAKNILNNYEIKRR